MVDGQSGDARRLIGFEEMVEHGRERGHQRWWWQRWVAQAKGPGGGTRHSSKASGDAMRSRRGFGGAEVAHRVLRWST